MSATTKPNSDSGPAPGARAAAEDDARRLDHITEGLETVQKDLAALGGSLGAGAKDLRRDVTGLLRDAHRDLNKMRRAVQRDLDRLQSDLTRVATGKVPPARRAKRQAAASSSDGESHHQPVVDFLDEARIAYELIEHEPVTSAAAESQAAQVPPDQVAKTILLHDGHGYVLAAVPASERVDLHKVRAALGRSRQLSLAGEDEIARDFPAIEVGAMPPFGPAVPAVEVFDQALTEPERVLCPAGDHRHSVLIAPHEIVRLTGAKVADVCQD
jgi:Ala-tRNA(Pro) deacylase